MRVRSLVILLAATLVGLVASAEGASRFSEFGGRLTGLPVKALFPSVQAVDTRGVIAAIAQPRPSGVYRLSVPTGIYIVAARAENSQGHGFSAFSAPARAHAGRRTKLSPHLTAVKPARAARVFPLAHGAVVTFGSLLVVDPDLGSALGGADLSATAINHFFNLCTPQGTVIVSSDPTFVAYQKQESALSRAGRLSTPYDYKPIKPQFRITGEAVVKRGAAKPPNNVGLTVTLTATDLRTGGVVAKGISEIVEGAVEIDSATLLAVVDEAVARLSAQGCGSARVGA